MMRRALVRTFVLWLQAFLLVAILHAHPANSGVPGLTSPSDEGGCPVCATFHSGQAPPVVPAAISAPHLIQQPLPPHPSLGLPEMAFTDISARGPPPPKTR
jgi:hypothetical protein